MGGVHFIGGNSGAAASSCRGTQEHFKKYTGEQAPQLALTHTSDTVSFSFFCVSSRGLWDLSSLTRD